MRHPIHLQAVLMSDELVDVFELDGLAVAAYGAYGPGAEGMHVGLFVVQYGDEAMARDALIRYEELQARQRHRAVAMQEGVRVFALGEAHWSAAEAGGRYFALALFVPKAEQAVGLVRAALERD